MNLGANITLVEIIIDSAFGRNYFGEIYFNFKDKWYKNSCKESKY